MFDKHVIFLAVSLCFVSVTAQIPAPITKTGCEAQNIAMSCTGSTYLLIEDMLFGRTDPNACNPVQNANCPSLRWALPKLQQYCNGRQTCNMKVRTEQWGDPCPGKSKHGSVTYRCVACQNTESNTNCEQWAAEGKCASQKDMWTKCYKTCSQCGKKDCGNKGTTSLQNKDIACDEWAMRGECKKNHDWMHKHCQQSCLSCVKQNPAFRQFCQDDRVQITCPAGHFLNIKDVSWGRTNTNTCPSTNIHSTNCPTPSGMLTEVKTRFNGRPGAWFNAFPQIWPATNCASTYKAGSLLYDCRVCSDLHTAYTCKQLKQHHSCDSVYMMNKCYRTCSGCKNFFTCGNTYTSHNDCNYKKSLNECTSNTWTMANCKETCGLCPQSDPECGDNYSVFSECDYWAGKGDCQKWPAFHQNNCPESCRFCTSPPVTPTAPTPVTLNFCENDRKEMVCPHGHGLIILAIFWGRKDNTTCAHGNIGTTNCATPALALDKAKELYNGRQRAWINGYNENWGNPCPNTFKAGSITFECRECVDILTAAACEQHKQNGDCETDNTMKNLCYKTCFECDKRQCGNTYTSDNDCANRASRNGSLCTTDQFTKDNCKKSCNTCPANNPNCVDNFTPESQCDYWGAKGECSLTTEHMANGCKETCNYCNISSAVLDQITSSTAPKIVKNGCEGDHLLLTCPDPNDYLYINDVFWGRKDRTSCPHIQIHTTNCTTFPWVLSKLQSFCNGRKSCYFNGWNALWGDPCPGTAKVASVTYTCTACNNTETDSNCAQWRSEGKCKDKDILDKCFKTCSQCGNLDCGNTYTGTPKSNCDEWAMRTKGECKANPFMTKYCKESCLMCTNRNPGTFCEGKNVELVCPSGHFISIDEMTWGRSDTTTCPHQSIKTTNCTTEPGVLEKARALYNGRERAWMIGQTSVWGDPCPGTYKAGTVLYSCKACVDHGSNCTQFKAAGHCKTKHDEAMSQCYKTCTGCDSRSCGNKFNNPASDCDFWAGQGDCKLQPFIDYHYTNCKESCNFCNTARKDIITPVVSGSAVTGKLQPTTYTLCEGGEIKLTCPTGSYLNIQGMFYGRLDAYTCPHVSISRKDCHSDSSNIKKLRTYANGLSSFWFPAISAPWGDSCYGTYKVAQVTYSCEACANKDSDSYCNQVLSDGKCSEQMNRCFKTCSQCEQRDCGNTYTPPFDCQSAAQNQCTNHPIWMEENCPKSCGKCNGNPYCKDAQVAESLCDRWALSGKCGGKNANLMTVQCKQSCQRCVPPVPQSVHMCEGLMKKLQCPDGYYINIKEVFWGRDQKSVCASNVHVTNCTTKTGVFEKVVAQLNGRNSGWFVALTSIYGDPCPTVTKEARIKYTCQVCSNTILDQTCEANAANDSCTSNYNHMSTNCFKSCTYCDKRNCGNTYTSTSNCWTWAKQGECNKNTVWMAVNCRQACNKCPVSNHACGNNYAPDVYCDSQAGIGKCTSDPEKMDVCKESCNKCPTANGNQAEVTE